VHWIYLAQVKDKWKVLVNQVMNLGVKEWWRSSCVAPQIVASRVVLSYMKLVTRVGRYLHHEVNTCKLT
jgi:hypothetical protein